MGMADHERPLPPGYEFVRPLGAGGFGEVILARHLMIGRLVAVEYTTTPWLTPRQ
jgi:serine/threonine protein kinase